MCVGVAYESCQYCCCSSSGSYCVPPSATVVCGTRNSIATAISDSSSKCKSRPIVMAAFHCHGRPIVRCIDRRKTVARERERDVKREGEGGPSNWLHRSHTADTLWQLFVFVWRLECQIFYCCGQTCWHPVTLKLWL